MQQRNETIIQLNKNQTTVERWLVSKNFWIEIIDTQISLTFFKEKFVKTK